MKSIITLLLVLSVIFLIDYFRRRKKGQSQQENKVAEQIVPIDRVALTPPRRVGKLKPTLINVGKFALLYIVIVLLSSSLSGLLGGISRNFTPQLYGISKFVAPFIVYCLVFCFLFRKYSLRQTAGLMSWAYGLISVLRVVFFAASTENSSTDVSQGVLPYVSLALLSGILYIISRSKASAKLNREVDGNRRVE